MAVVERVQICDLAMGGSKSASKQTPNYIGQGFIATATKEMEQSRKFPINENTIRASSLQNHFFPIAILQLPFRSSPAQASENDVAKDVNPYSIHTTQELKSFLKNPTRLSRN
jgi:hypothetical protein